MTKTPNWLTILKQTANWNRDLALQELGRSVAELESLRRGTAMLRDELATESRSAARSEQPRILNLDQLRLARESRHGLLTELSRLQQQQESVAAQIAERRTKLQQCDSESQKLQRLTERLMARQIESQCQIANREAHESLADQTAERTA